MSLQKTILLLFVLLRVSLVNAQYCDLVNLSISGQSNLDFTFDTFSKYLAGITQNGTAKLKVTVDNSIRNSIDCRWNLAIYIENGNGATPANEWETLYSQSTSGSVPQLDLLQLRVANQCNTPLTGNQFFPAPTLASTPIVIISNNGITTPAGSCITNVNGPGSAKTHYDEYSFDIDIRLVPGMSHKSGIYQIRLKYVLSEVL